jgi:hypothetical protein
MWGRSDIPLALTRTRDWVRSCLTGIFLLAMVAAARVLFSVAGDQTFFLGRAFGAVCSFRARFGIPCPNCGMTRSVILAAHGEFSQAAHFSWGGVALVVGMLIVAVALLTLGAIQFRGDAEAARRASRAFRKFVLTMSASVAVVWAIGWGVAVWRCLR